MIYSPIGVARDVRVGVNAGCCDGRGSGGRGWQTGSKEALRWLCRTGPWCAGTAVRPLRSQSVSSSFIRAEDCYMTLPGVLAVERHGEGTVVAEEALARTRLEPSTPLYVPHVARRPKSHSNPARAVRSIVVTVTRQTGNLPPLPPDICLPFVGPRSYLIRCWAERPEGARPPNRGVLVPGAKSATRCRGGESCT